MTAPRFEKGPPQRGEIKKSPRSRAAAERREGKRLIVGQRKMAMSS